MKSNEIPLASIIFWITLTSLVIFSSIIPAVEYFGLVDLVNINLPYELPQLAEAVGAIGTIVLTLSLVVLYREQAKILENHGELMEEQHKPRIELNSARLIDSPTQTDGAGRLLVNLTNSGEGTATNLEIRICPETPSGSSIELKEREAIVDRVPELGSDDFVTKGEYISPKEQGVRMWFSPLVEWKSKEGRGATGVNLLAHNAAYAEGADIERVVQIEKMDENRNEVFKKINFDRVRYKVILDYENIRGEQFSDVIIDMILPVRHCENSSTMFNSGIDYDQYKWQMERYPANFDVDPLERNDGVPDNLEIDSDSPPKFE